MKSARLATPAEDEPGFVVLAQGPVVNAEPAGPCPRCSRLKELYCDCHRLEEFCTLFNAAMIPAFYIKATLPPLELQNQPSASRRRSVKAVTKWARRERLPEQGLLLSGPNGVGKSFNGQGLESELFESLQMPQVLILDDVGSNRVSTWSRDVFQTIIAARYDACGRTFVTTNLPITSIGAASFSAFEKWTGHHCTSRLAEMCFWFPVDGPDRRRPPYSRPRPTVPHKA